MGFSDLSYNIRIELDTKNCECTAQQIEKMERGLDTLAKLVKPFPVSDLYITVIYHAPSNDYHVKTALVLPGRTLFTGDRGPAVLPAYEQCVRKLVRKVTAYKQRMSAAAEHSKRVAGTQHDVVPTDVPDADVLGRAVEDYDYAAFRKAMTPYESPLRSRIGRWVGRYPQMEREIGNSFTIADIEEEVFLNAFERFADRPRNVSLAQWLEGMIDPSVRLLLANPDEELENIEMIRSAREEPR